MDKRHRWLSGWGRALMLVLVCLLSGCADRMGEVVQDLLVPGDVPAEEAARRVLTGPETPEVAATFAVTASQSTDEGMVIIYRMDKPDGMVWIGSAFMRVEDGVWQFKKSGGGGYDSTAPAEMASGLGIDSYGSHKTVTGPVFNPRVTLVKVRLKDGSTLTTAPSKGVFAFFVDATEDVCAMEQLDAEGRRMGLMDPVGCR